MNMQRTEINSGPFTMLVSLCGKYWVAPGEGRITRRSTAERLARLYGRMMAKGELRDG